MLRRQGPWATTLLVTLVGGLTPHTAEAFTGAPHTLREALERADVVIEGEIEGVRFEERAEAPGWVFTLYDVRVDEALRGSPAPTLTVSVPGGVAGDGRWLLIPGAPTFTTGDVVLLQLATGGGGGWYRLPSWSHGILRQVDGVALVGADARPRPVGACVEVAEPANPTSGAASLAVDGSDLDNDPPEVPRGEPMPWAEATLAVRDCVAEVTP